MVFLTGLEDGVFPHARSLGDQPELEEERRLAYVGVTRAQQRLYVSRAVVRSAWGAPSAQPGVAVPRRAARRPRRLAPHRGRADLVEPARPASGSPARLGQPTAAGRRNFASAAALRADAAAEGQAGPARSRPWNPATGCMHDTFGHGHRGGAGGCRRQVGRLDRLRLARASSGCCCATRRWRSSDPERDACGWIGERATVESGRARTHQGAVIRADLTARKRSPRRSVRAAGRGRPAPGRGRPGRRRRGGPRGGGGGR